MNTLDQLKLNNDQIIETAIHDVWYKLYRNNIGLKENFDEDIWETYLKVACEEYFKVDITKEELIKLVQEKYLNNPPIKEKYFEEIKHSDFEYEKRKRVFNILLLYGSYDKYMNINDDKAYEEYKKRYGNDISMEELFDLITEELIRTDAENKEDVKMIKELRTKKN